MALPLILAYVGIALMIALAGIGSAYGGFDGWQCCHRRFKKE